MIYSIHKGPAVERWLRDAAEAGSRKAMSRLAHILELDGRYEDLEHWLRRTIEKAIPYAHSAMFDLRTLLLRLGRDKESQQLSRFGIEPGGRTADPW